MTTKVEKSVVVNVPVSVAYNQWTQFEEFPHFMGGVKSVTQLSDDRLQWVAEIAGVRREWEATILEQVPDTKVAWAATEGATNAGAVTFQPAGAGQTQIHLTLEYEPEGLVEKAGDALNIVENQAEKDLEKFKAFIEDEGYASGAWRGQIDSGLPVGTPDVDDAAASRGDSGKAGVSGKLAAAAGVGLAAAAAGVAAAKSGGSKEEDVADLAVTPEPVERVEPVEPVGSASAAPIADAPAATLGDAPTGADPTSGLDAPTYATPGADDAIVDDTVAQEDPTVSDDAIADDDSNRRL
jgi:hypothetical protein